MNGVRVMVEAIGGYPVWRIGAAIGAFLVISVPLDVIGRRVDKGRGRTPIKLWLREIGSDIRWLGWGVGIVLSAEILVGHWTDLWAIALPLLKLQIVTFAMLITIAAFSVGQVALTDTISINSDIDELDKRNLLTLIPLAVSISKIALYVISLVAGLGSIGIDVAPFIQAGAVVTVIVGLAIQTTLQDLFATLFLFTDRVLYVGDRVRYIEGEYSFEGTVQKITAMRTFIAATNGDVMILSNRKLDRIVKL